jgi:hypothetical protein
VDLPQEATVFVAASLGAEGASPEVLDRCLARTDPAVPGTARLAD